MKKKIKYICLATVLFLPLSADLHPADFIENELLPREIQLLQQNQLITKTRPIDGEDWPEVILYILIKASPMQCAAIFSNYPDQSKFSKSVMESKAVLEISPTLTHVSFLIDMPWPVANSITVTKNHLSRNPGGGYQVKWELIESGTLKKNRGIARFIPYRGHTVYRYQNFVTPSMSIGKMFKKRMIKDTQASVQSFTRYAVKMLKENLARVRSLVKKMNDKLATENNPAL